jgi:hypothetical protein
MGAVDNDMGRVIRTLQKADNSTHYISIVLVKYSVSFLGYKNIRAYERLR